MYQRMLTAPVTTQTGARLPAFVAGIAAALVGAVMALCPPTAAAGQAFPILAVDPLASGVVLENHEDALAHWAGKGFSGEVLLHVDLHDDLRIVEAEKIAALKDLVARGDFASVTRAGRGGAAALFHGGNLVRAAAALGIVREVVWVVPFTFLGDADAATRLKDYLGKAGFPAADIETFRPDGGCFRGASGALSLAVCSQEGLPGIADPVLVSVDADFLPHAAGYRGVTPLTEIRALAAALRAARYAVKDVVVSLSVQSGRVPVGLRWVGEAVVEVLRDPSLALQREPPARWEGLQRLWTLRAKGRQARDEMLDVAFSLLENRPHDPALMFFAAEAMAGHGGGESALGYAGQACQADRGYCVGLREIGLQLLGRGDTEGAARFFAEAERLLPGMAYGQIDEGLLFARAGRPAEALAAFEKVVARDGGFSASFLAGAVHAASGDRAAARRAYDAGVAALARSPQALVGRAEVAAAIRGAAGFYREEGLLAEAERLENDARLRLPPDDAWP